jgi:hypothetical protein
VSSLGKNPTVTGPLAGSAAKAALEKMNAPVIAALSSVDLCFMVVLGYDRLGKRMVLAAGPWTGGGRKQRPEMIQEQVAGIA